MFEDINLGTVIQPVGWDKTGMWLFKQGDGSDWAIIDFDDKDPVRKYPHWYFLKQDANGEWTQLRGNKYQNASGQWSPVEQM